MLIMDYRDKQISSIAVTHNTIHKKLNFNSGQVTTNEKRAVKFYVSYMLKMVELCYVYPCEY